jgi:hypothetical protein
MRFSTLPAIVAFALFGIAKLGAQTPALNMGTLNANPALSRASLQSCGLAVDSAGSVYLGLFDSTLRKVAADGTVTVVAGSPGQNGSVDGTAGNARLDADVGLAVDASQVVYVCELSGAIRRVTPDGNVTTIAGVAGSSGFADGTGSAARFNGATRICFDPTSEGHARGCGDDNSRQTRSDGLPGRDRPVRPLHGTHIDCLRRLGQPLRSRL